MQIYECVCKWIVRASFVGIIIVLCKSCHADHGDIFLKWNSRRSKRSTRMESMSKILRGGISRSLSLSLSLSQPFNITGALLLRWEVQGEAEPVPQWVNVCDRYGLPRRHRRCSHGGNERRELPYRSWRCPDEPWLPLRYAKNLSFFFSIVSLYDLKIFLLKAKECNSITKKNMN